MVKNIIFDLGGVLIGWSPKYVYREIFDTDKEVDWFLNNICTLHWNEEQDGGRTIKEANQLLIKEHPEWEKQILTYYDRWEEMLSGPIYKSVEILQHLENYNKHRLYALTNWSAELFPIARKKYDFLNIFRGILVSGEEHLKKPDPAIYNLIMDRYKLAASESLFIDDNLRNIEAADLLGMKVIHFINADQLRKDLKNKFDIVV